MTQRRSVYCGPRVQVAFVIKMRARPAPGVPSVTTSLPPVGPGRPWPLIAKRCINGSHKRRIEPSFYALSAAEVRIRASERAIEGSRSGLAADSASTIGNFHVYTAASSAVSRGKSTSERRAHFPRKCIKVAVRLTVDTLTPTPRSVIKVLSVNRWSRVRRVVHIIVNARPRSNQCPTCREIASQAHKRVSPTILSLPAFPLPSNGGAGDR